MKTFLIILITNFFLLSSLSFPLCLSLGAENEKFRQLRSSHFIVNYQDEVDKNYVRKVKKEAEDSYRKITQEFHLVRDKLWLWDNRAQIFIADNQKEYRKLFNCPRWSAACVDYRNKKIYTYPGQKNFISILAHELTHIIFREYLDRQHLPLWLDEGMAIYTESKFGKSNYKKPLFKIQEKIENNSYIPLDELVKINPQILEEKSNSYVNDFYLESFSLINFLIEKYKRYRFSQFLWNIKNSTTVKEALAKTYYQLKDIEKLEEKWTDFYKE